MIRALLVVALIGGAAAADDVSKAATFYETGKRHFDLAEYAAAIEDWREAYRLSNEPLLLFNIAQAYRLAGDCAQANRFYLTYQSLVPKPTNRIELESAMQKCEGIAPATGDSTGAAPPVIPPPAPPPEPVATPRQPVPASPVHVDEPPARPGRSLQIAGIATAGGGAVASMIAVGYALSARSNGNTISNQPMPTEWDGRLADIEGAGRSAQTRARVFGVFGVAAIATGVVMWRIGRQRAVRVDVSLGATRAQAGLACDF